MFGASGTAICLTLLTQLVLPPAFLHFYGVSRYGEWLVLSASLNYLSTLNFGITTYASNQLTMLRKRGEVKKYSELQGSTMALLLSMICIGLVICSSAFFLPLATLLHLSILPPADIALTAFFLGLQAMVNIFGGYCTGLFMVVEETHRGMYWNYARWISGIIVSVPLAMLRVRFSVIAIGQLVAVLIVTLLTIHDLKRRLVDLPLGIQGASWKTAKATLAPSGMFAMIFTQQFLIFQAPVIMLQWILGPAVVVLFSISRTILSTARQVPTAVISAIAPEITFSFADRNMKKLLNIFRYSEQIVFATILVANLGAFLFSPILLAIWLHKPGLFDPVTYCLMALISCAMSVREHKQFFQFSTNTHKRLSIIVFFGNLLMIGVSIPFTQKFGLRGFLSIWFASEIAQIGLLYYENMRLFGHDVSMSFIPLLRLIVAIGISMPICIFGVEYALRHSLLLVAAVAMTGTSLLVAECYFAFGLKSAWDQLQLRISYSTKRP
jgi:O-antigen/teichoic acid export membrane protein